MPTTMNDVSIIIPSKNEEKSIFECVTRVFNVYPEAEVIVVDSGLDGTCKIIHDLQKKYPTLI
ncbi:MAG: glycosyltransferase [Deltaproteobacteria bacterium]|nr:MAG: glycosyltransferase [Deltaproteobacteria bacterium]